jgi:hypothetical protein
MTVRATRYEIDDRDRDFSPIELRFLCIARLQATPQRGALALALEYERYRRICPDPEARPTGDQLDELLLHRRDWTRFRR